MNGSFLAHSLVTTAGAAVLSLGLADVFMTVLYARAGTGPVSHRLARWMWAIVRRVARRFPRAQSAILSFFGPAYLVTLISLWIAMLLLGFTLLTWPGMGRGIRSQSGETPTDFISAFQYAGGSLTTVGSNDLRPATSFYKILGVIDSTIGVSVVTLTLSYVIQIYSALQRRNSLVLSLHHASGGTGDAAALLAGLGPRDDFTHAESQLAGLATEVTSVYESHNFYSVLIYFRFPEPYYAMARGSLVLMELLTLIDTSLDENRHGWLRRTASVTEMREGGMHVLNEFAEVYLPKGPPDMGEPSGAVADRWKQRHQAATDHLRRCGISVASDPIRAAERYVELRRQWDAYIMAFAHYMEHTPEEIDPAGADPAETARNREMPTPPLRATR